MGEQRRALCGAARGGEVFAVRATRVPASIQATTSEAAQHTARSKASPGALPAVRRRTSTSRALSLSSSRTTSSPRRCDARQWMRRAGSPG
jgi:hypothetical protein